MNVYKYIYIIDLDDNVCTNDNGQQQQRVNNNRRRQQMMMAVVLLTVNIVAQCDVVVFILQLSFCNFTFCVVCVCAVSYTHLDVYKRQV